MMYAPMNSRYRPANNTKAPQRANRETVRLINQRPVYQAKNQAEPTPPMQGEAIHTPQNSPGNTQQQPQAPQNTQMNGGAQGARHFQPQGNNFQRTQNTRPMQNGMRPNQGGILGNLFQGGGKGILGKILSMEDPVGSLNKLVTIMKLFG